MKRVVALGAAIAALVVVFATWIGSDRAAAKRVFDEYSVENTSDSGLSLAFHYLQRTGHPTARLEHALRPRVAAADGVVFRFGPLRMPVIVDDEEDEKKSKPDTRGFRPKRIPIRMIPLPLTTEEEAWVRGGGRLVLGIDNSGARLDIRHVNAKSADEVFPLWPDVRSVALPEGRGLVGSSVPARMVTIYQAASEPVIVREAIGAGDLIVMAVPEVFQNSALRSGNHVELLTAMIGKRPVYFDETIHGLAASDSAIDLLKEWGLGPFLLLALVTALLVFWRRATRIGGAEDDHRELRSDAVDLVDSLGALYRKAMTDGEALTLYRETLVRTVAAQTGLRGDALHRRVSEITRRVAPAGDTKLSAGALRRHLEAINEGFRSLEGRRARRASGELHAKHR